MPNNIKNIEGVNFCSTDSVFYNPAQKINRDISILVIEEMVKDKKNVKLLECMSASGIRAIRYSKEIKSIDITVNDISKESIEMIKKNLKLNNIPYEMGDKQYKDFNNGPNNEDLKKVTSMEDSVEIKNIKIFNDDCKRVMMNSPCEYDIIDLDPYGSSVPFIQAALYSVKNNGMVCFTFTDMAVLCSKKERCYDKYGCILEKDPAFNEMAIRIALFSIESEAKRQDFYIIPVFSFCVDFYLRVFVIVKKRKKNKKNSHFYKKCNCGYEKINFFKKKSEENGNFNEGIDILETKKMHLDILEKRSKHIVPSNEEKCNICSYNKRLCGPFWSGKLYSQEFISSLIKKKSDDRLYGILSLIHQELDTFLFYHIPTMCSYLGVNCIRLIVLCSALKNSGFEVSLTHCRENSLKSNAPKNLILGLIKKYKDSPEDKIFQINKEVEAQIERNYFRKLSKSGQGPLSRPK